MKKLFAQASIIMLITLDLHAVTGELLIQVSGCEDSTAITITIKKVTNMDGSDQTLVSDTLKHNNSAQFRPN